MYIHTYLNEVSDYDYTNSLYKCAWLCGVGLIMIHSSLCVNT